MTEQPTALRLADALMTLFPSREDGERAAATNRCIADLAAQRYELLEALKLARPYISTHTLDGYHAEIKADAAIKAVEEGE